MSQEGGGSFFDRFRILGENETFVPGIGGGLSIVPKDQAAEFFEISKNANAVLAGTLAVGAGGVAIGAAAPTVAGSTLVNQGLLVAGAAQQTLVRSIVVRSSSAALSIPVVGPFAAGAIEGAFQESRGLPSQSSLSGARNAGNFTGRFFVRGGRALRNAGATAGSILSDLLD